MLSHIRARARARALTHAFLLYGFMPGLHALTSPTPNPDSSFPSPCPFSASLLLSRPRKPRVGRSLSESVPSGREGQARMGSVSQTEDPRRSHHGFHGANIHHSLLLGGGVTRRVDPCFQRGALELFSKNRLEKKQAHVCFAGEDNKRAHGGTAVTCGLRASRLACGGPENAPP